MSSAENRIVERATQKYIRLLEYHRQKCVERRRHSAEKSSILYLKEMSHEDMCTNQMMKLRVLAYVIPPQQCQGHIVQLQLVLCNSIWVSIMRISQE